MKKAILDLTVRSVERLHERYVLIKLTQEQPLPEILPGQYLSGRRLNNKGSVVCNDRDVR